MISDRDALEGQRLNRRRVVLAFRDGRARPSLLDEPHPLRAFGGGLAVMILVVIGAGISGLLAGGPPDGWNSDGNLVVDDATGARYVVTDGRLRAVVNDTSLRLLFGGPGPAPIEVPAATVRSASRGAPIGIAEVPFAPPSVVRDALLLACSSATGEGKGAVLLAAAAAPDAAGASLLVASEGRTHLVTEGRAYSIASGNVATALGYPAEPQLEVAQSWLALIPPGPALRSIDVARGGAQGGRPPWTRPGTLVSERGSGRLFVAQPSGLRPVLNRTTLNLVYGPRVPRPAQVARAAIRTQRLGRPLGRAEWPPSPPPATTLPSGGWACADHTGVASVHDGLPTGGLERAGDLGARETSLWTPRDRGVLIASATRPEEANEDPIAHLLAQGRSFPVATNEALAALGYGDAPVTIVPDDWLAATPQGPLLEVLEP
ncbi:MAG: type VII secretion protein EccB [Actinomycetota bacterium]